MKIWLINHYAVPPQYYPLARPSLFAKNLQKIGHDVTIIAASTIHNSDCKNLISDSEKTKIITDNGIPYVLINCTPYKGNDIHRIKNILEFSRKLHKVLDTLEKPDVIVATSFDPFTCYEGIKYGNKHDIKTIAEIADLWPETLVAYKGLSDKNPVVKYLRNLEKKIYKQADVIIYTAEGMYNYIIKQGWQKEIPRDKVVYINNGIDLELFDYNKKTFITRDPHLDDDTIFKVVYTGSIRKVNSLGLVLDVAKEVRNPGIMFLIWGDGDELPYLKQRIIKEEINNVVFKGKVEKKYIPYITSKADINYAHNSPSPLFEYGLSFNKIFDYLAAGKPILCDFPANYNPVIQGGAGLSVESAEKKDIARQIEVFAQMDQKTLKKYGDAARKSATEYDFKILTNKLMEAIKSIQ